MSPLNTSFRPPGGRPTMLLRPDRVRAPVIVVSCHSGRDYPQAFRSQSRLTAHQLRFSEDAFVDDLFGAAPLYGMPLLVATFPRAYCDANREKWELDPAMFADTLPQGVRVSGPRIDAGLGTIARVVANGQPIYREKLRFHEAEQRIETCWQPFHDQLRGLIDETRARFGRCIVIDCHSMPPVWGAEEARPAFVLGDAHGAACSASVTKKMEGAIEKVGEKCAINNPYSGGYITKYYGNPRIKVDVIQLEVPRVLYMRDPDIMAGDEYNMMRRKMEKLITLFSAAFE
ncbi:MAG: N-formylglutamate amidohydrolase [Rhodospirillales bacterium]|nr:N-formylglutamate amidohydrolase [Rhodospirillales bacterium]